jgi:hypothetical protein
LPGEAGVGVTGKQNGRRGKFFEQEEFFHSVGASESEDGVGSETEMLLNPRGGESVQSLKGGALEKGRAGEVNFLPKTSQRGVGVEAGSGKFGMGHTK